MTNKRIAGGVIVGVLYMGIEGVGAIVLIKALLHSGGENAASTFTLITYAMAAANVFSAALGFVVMRTAASSSDRTQLIPFLAVVRRFLLVTVGAALVVILGVLAISITFGSVHWNTGACWMLFAVGHAARIVGLQSAFVRVGGGQLGADKFYQLCIAIAFYSVALALASATNSPLLPSAVSYALITAIVASVAVSMLARSLQVDAGAQASPIQMAELARGTAGQLAFAAAGFVAANADALVVRTMFTDRVFVEYSLLAKVCQAIALIAGLVAAMYLPLITRSHYSRMPSHTRQLCAQSLMLTVAAAVLGVLALLLGWPWIREWLFGNTFSLEPQVLWIMCALTITQAFCLPLVGALLAIGNQSTTKITVISAGLALIAALLLGATIGPVGAALGPLLAGLTLLVLAAKLLRRDFGQQQ